MKTYTVGDRLFMGIVLVVLGCGVAFILATVLGYRLKIDEPSTIVSTPPDPCEHAPGYIENYDPQKPRLYVSITMSPGHCYYVPLKEWVKPSQVKTIHSLCGFNGNCEETK